MYEIHSHAVPLPTARIATGCASATRSRQRAAMMSGPIPRTEIKNSCAVRLLLAALEPPRAQRNHVTRKWTLLPGGVSCVTEPPLLRETVTKTPRSTVLGWRRLRRACTPDKREVGGASRSGPLTGMCCPGRVCHRMSKPRNFGGVGSGPSVTPIAWLSEECHSSPLPDPLRTGLESLRLRWFQSVGDAQGIAAQSAPQCPFFVSSTSAV